jgi:hypothetical protein
MVIHFNTQVANAGMAWWGTGSAGDAAEGATLGTFLDRARKNCPLSQILAYR